MDSLYKKWNQTAVNISEGKLANWKRNKDVCEMLEHVEPKYATVYLAECLKELSVEQVQEYVQMCDLVGNPNQVFFSAINLHCSPTCLRYLSHALLILKEPITDPIVEIGGGYGGLVLAINFVSKLKGFTITSYSILDLPNVQKLQEYYLNHFTLSFPVAFPHEVKEACFLISNYSLAEMGEANRKTYIQNLVLPYAKKGFLVWNSKESYKALEDHFSIQVREEIPKTGPHNKFINFQLLS